MIFYCYAYIDNQGFSPDAMMQDAPTVQYKYHDIGNLSLTVTNFGMLGNGGEWKIYGKRFPSCEFPEGSGAEYLFMGALWVGTIIQTSDTTVDTLVSVGADGWLRENEFWPTSADSDTIYERSTRDGWWYDAVSEQDFLMAYKDDFIDGYSPAAHIPLGMRIEQTDYAWSYAYNRDYVFIKFDIINERNETFKFTYVGFFIDADIGPWGPDYVSEKCQDDITGFSKWKNNSDTLWGSDYYDKDGNSITGTRKTNDPGELINLAWAADFDGDKKPDPCLPGHPLHLDWPVSTDGVTGIRLLSPCPEEISYNWWISNTEDELDWGPSRTEPGDVEGTPMGDINKYRIMSNGYVDPDMVGERGVNADPYYTYPPDVDSINDNRYLISYGPFEIESRDTLTLTIVYIGGENFVEEYGVYNFEDIALNASWAYRIYDNPGFDTPEIPGDTTTCDGYRGDFVLYDTTGIPFDDADTVWLTGDGIPDFVGPPPPPIPNVKVIPEDQRAIILWDDISEDYTNIFIKTLKGIPSGLDTNYFEGYRVYRSETGVPGEWMLLKEFDRIDFTDSTGTCSTGTIPIAWNRGMPPDTIIDGKKWYKYVDRGILNYTPYYYGVSAFDKGWPFNQGSILPALESSIDESETVVYPSSVNDGAKKVIVIPNPYRVSQTSKYIELGWEGYRYDWGWPHRRRICFANLPRECTVRIFTLSGDLIKTIKHNYSQHNKSYEDWNLRTEDIQEIVSGIYLFSVENHSNGGIQVGKFVVIK